MTEPVFYHGTRTPFRGAGAFLFPPSLHGAPRRAGVQHGDEEYVYFTTDRDQAEWYAHNSKGRARPRVLVVQPLAAVEVDPTPYDHERHQYRCREGAKVLSVTVLPTLTAS